MTNINFTIAFEVECHISKIRVFGLFVFYHNNSKTVNFRKSNYLAIYMQIKEREGINIFWLWVDWKMINIKKSLILIYEWWNKTTKYTKKSNKRKNAKNKIILKRRRQNICFSALVIKSNLTIYLVERPEYWID